MPLVVLEGLDGAGKSTQLEMLRTKVAATLNRETEYLHFPRPEIPVYGEFIARFLRGDFGEVEPYTLALMFAGDRREARPILRRWLDEGKWIFLDRYVYSNVAYQCAKVQNVEARERLKKWILELEFEIYAIPKPDLSLFLDVPFRFTAERLSSARQGADRDYLAGGRDVHESSLDLQQRVREAYLEAAKADPALKIIDCGDRDGNMLPPDEIFQKILLHLPI